MRTIVLALVRELAARVAFSEPVYEFGAAAAAGQEGRARVRDFFPGKRYVGCDLVRGPNVDEIQDLHRLDLPDSSVGTALLFDAVEHVREPWRAMAELRRCLAPGGIVVMTSVMYFPVHAHPDDYWRFTASGFRVLLDAFEDVHVVEAGMRKLPHTVVGVASKGPLGEPRAAAVSAALDEWKRSGARSWKETALALMPPVLLVPAYDLFAGLERALARRRAG